jgi:hypothetical protein
MTNPSEQHFRLTHNNWSAIPADRLGERVRIHRLRGGASDNFWVSLRPGGRVASSGLPGECLVSVCSGRVTCRVLGNEVELPSGHFALLPPYIPFELRAAGRSEATAVACCSPAAGDRLPFESS